MAPRTARTIALACCAAALACATGCYRHVVGAKGPGAERYDVQQPNIGRDESVWSTPTPRSARDENYGLGQGSDVPGQVRRTPKPKQQDD